MERMRNACKTLVGKLVDTTYKTKESMGVYENTAENWMGGFGWISMVHNRHQWSSL